MDEHDLTAALIYVTSTWIDHPATAGIDHIKTAAVIGNLAFASMFPVAAVRFTDIEFFVGHGAPSFVYVAPVWEHNCWFGLGSPDNRR